MRLVKPRYKQVDKVIEEPYADTQNCLAIWDFFKPRMGKITSVECDGEVTTVTGSARTLKLRGCNCGYYGTGPHGTAQILRDVGIDTDKEEDLIGQKPIKIMVDAGSEES